MIFTKSEDLFAGHVESFRPIYYLGCKTTIADAIKNAINDVDPTRGPLLDLFSGTGAVATSIADSRYVATVDVQEYSRVLCSAQLNPPGLTTSFVDKFMDCIAHGKAISLLSWCLQPLIDFEQHSIDSALKGNLEGLIELLESPPLVAYENCEAVYSDSYLGEAAQIAVSRLMSEGLSGTALSTVCRNFAGIYFSFEQAIALDAVLSMAADSDSSIQDTLKASALSTASTLVNTIGKQFAQPIQPRNRAGVIKSGLARRVYRDRSIDALTTQKIWLEKYTRLPVRKAESKILRLDYIDALERFGETFSVVYADPPYTRDHYSRFYHVLETMCLRDNPKISKVTKNGKTVISRGVYREDRHQSPFCIRSSAPKAFDTLFSSARKYDLPLVLSYSPHEDGDGTHPRAMSMEQLVSIANQYYNKVEICSIEGTIHNKLNRNGLALKTREHAEVIFKCTI